MLYRQYQQCTQRIKTVSAYTKEFFRLSARNNLIEKENQLVSQYIGGLKDPIKDKLELNDVWTMAQVVNLAFKVEIQLNRSPRYAVHQRISLDPVLEHQRLHFEPPRTTMIGSSL